MKTSDIAREIGVHENTVRLYEKWGLLPPVPRLPNGYRVYDESHLDQGRLIRIAMECTWIGGDIRRVAHKVIRAAAAGDWETALDKAEQHLKMIRAERRRALKAAEVLEDWAREPESDGEGFLNIGEVARLLDVSQDMLRNWERDQLITVPRQEHNGYRLYSRREIDRLRVIRMLRQARYSTMSIMRMLRQLDQDQEIDVRKVLDTPGQDEDLVSASDKWLTALQQTERQAAAMVVYVAKIRMKNSLHL